MRVKEPYASIQSLITGIIWLWRIFLLLVFIFFISVIWGMAVDAHAAQVEGYVTCYGDGTQSVIYRTVGTIGRTVHVTYRYDGSCRAAAPAPELSRCPEPATVWSAQLYLANPPGSAPAAYGQALLAACAARHGY